MSMGKPMSKCNKFHQVTVTISDAALHFFNAIFKKLFVTYQSDQFEIHYSMQSFFLKRQKERKAREGNEGRKESKLRTVEQRRM